MVRYRVSRRASLIHKGVHIEPGTMLPTDNLGLTQKQLDEKVQNGFIIAVGSDAEKHDFGPRVTEVSVPLELKPGDGAIIKDPREKQNKAVGQWMHDPKTLQKLTLEQLNTMVIETDASVKPFETREEAIAQLSYDLKH